jgi:hypothetical protein
MLYIIVILAILVLVTLYVKFFKNKNKNKNNNFTLVKTLKDPDELIQQSYYEMNDNLKNGIYNSGFNIYSKDSGKLSLLTNPRKLNFINILTVFVYLDSFLNIYFPQIDIDHIRQFILMEKFTSSDYIDNISDFIQSDIELGDSMKADVSTQIKMTNSLLTNEFKFFILYGESDNKEDILKKYNDRKEFIEGAIERINDYKKRYKNKKISKNMDSYYDEYNYTSIEIIKSIILMNSINEFELIDSSVDIYQQIITNIIELCETIKQLSFIDRTPTYDEVILNNLGFYILQQLNVNNGYIEYDNIMAENYQFALCINSNNNLEIFLENSSNLSYNLSTSLNFTIESHNKHYNQVNTLYSLSSMANDYIYELNFTNESFSEQTLQSLYNESTEYLVTLFHSVMPLVNNDMEDMICNIFNNTFTMNEIYTFLLNINEISKITNFNQAGLNEKYNEINKKFIQIAYDTNVVEPSDVTIDLTKNDIFSITGCYQQLGSCYTVFEKQFKNGEFDPNNITRKQKQQLEKCLINANKAANKPLKGERTKLRMRRYGFEIIMGVIDALGYLIMLLTIVASFGGSTGIVATGLSSLRTAVSAIGTGVTATIKGIGAGITLGVYYVALVLDKIQELIMLGPFKILFMKFGKLGAKSAAKLAKETVDEVRDEVVKKMVKQGFIKNIDDISRDTTGELLEIFKSKVDEIMPNDLLHKQADFDLFSRKSWNALSGGNAHKKILAQKTDDMINDVIAGNFDKLKFTDNFMSATGQTAEQATKVMTKTLTLLSKHVIEDSPDKLKKQLDKITGKINKQSLEIDQIKKQITDIPEPLTKNIDDTLKETLKLSDDAFEQVKNISDGKIDDVLTEIFFSKKLTSSEIDDIKRLFKLKDDDFIDPGSGLISGVKNISDDGKTKIKEYIQENGINKEMEDFLTKKGIQLGDEFNETTKLTKSSQEQLTNKKNKLTNKIETIDKEKEQLLKKQENIQEKINIVDEGITKALEANTKNQKIYVQQLTKTILETNPSYAVSISKAANTNIGNIDIIQLKKIIKSQLSKQLDKGAKLAKNIDDTIDNVLDDKFLDELLEIANKYKKASVILTKQVTEQVDEVVTDGIKHIKELQKDFSDTLNMIKGSGSTKRQYIKNADEVIKSYEKTLKDLVDKQRKEFSIYVKQEIERVQRLRKNAELIKKEIKKFTQKSDDIQNPYDSLLHSYSSTITRKSDELLTKIPFNSVMDETYGVSDDIIKEIEGELDSLMADILKKSSTDKKIYSILFRQSATKSLPPLNDADNLDELLDVNVLTGIAEEATRIRGEFVNLSGLIDEVDFDNFFKQRLKEKYGDVIKRLKPDEILDDKADEFVDVFIDEIFNNVVRYSKNLDDYIGSNITDSQRVTEVTKVIDNLEVLMRKNTEDFLSMPKESLTERAYLEFRVDLLKRNLDEITEINAQHPGTLDAINNFDNLEQLVTDELGNIMTIEELDKLNLKKINSRLEETRKNIEINDERLQINMGLKSQDEEKLGKITTDIDTMQQNIQKLTKELQTISNQKKSTQVDLSEANTQIAKENAQKKLDELNTKIKQLQQQKTDIYDTLNGENGLYNTMKKQESELLELEKNHRKLIEVVRELRSDRDIAIKTALDDKNMEIAKLRSKITESELLHPANNNTAKKLADTQEKLGFIKKNIEQKEARLREYKDNYDAFLKAPATTEKETIVYGDGAKPPKFLRKANPNDPNDHPSLVVDVREIDGHFYTKIDDKLVSLETDGYHLFNESQYSKKTIFVEKSIRDYIPDITDEDTYQSTILRLKQDISELKQEQLKLTDKIESVKPLNDETFIKKTNDDIRIAEEKYAKTKEIAEKDFERNIKEKGEIAEQINNLDIKYIETLNNSGVHMKKLDEIKDKITNNQIEVEKLQKQIDESSKLDDETAQNMERLTQMIETNKKTVDEFKQEQEKLETSIRNFDDTIAEIENTKKKYKEIQAENQENLEQYRQDMMADNSPSIVNDIEDNVGVSSINDGDCMVNIGGGKSYILVEEEISEKLNSTVIKDLEEYLNEGPIKTLNEMIKDLSEETKEAVKEMTDIRLRLGLRDIAAFLLVKPDFVNTNLKTILYRFSELLLLPLTLIVKTTKAIIQKQPLLNSEALFLKEMSSLTEELTEAQINKVKVILKRPKVFENYSKFATNGIDSDVVIKDLTKLYNKMKRGKYPLTQNIKQETFNLFFDKMLKSDDLLYLSTKNLKYFDEGELNGIILASNIESLTMQQLKQITEGMGKEGINMENMIFDGTYNFILKKLKKSDELLKLYKNYKTPTTPIISVMINKGYRVNELFSSLQLIKLFKNKLAIKQIFGEEPNQFLQNLRSNIDFIPIDSSGEIYTVVKSALDDTIIGAEKLSPMISMKEYINMLPKEFKDFSEVENLFNSVKELGDMKGKFVEDAFNTMELERVTKSMDLNYGDKTRETVFVTRGIEDITKATDDKVEETVRSSFRLFFDTIKMSKVGDVIIYIWVKMKQIFNSLKDLKNWLKKVFSKGVDDKTGDKVVKETTEILERVQKASDEGATSIKVGDEVVPISEINTAAGEEIKKMTKLAEVLSDNKSYKTVMDDLNNFSFTDDEIQQYITRNIDNITEIPLNMANKFDDKLLNGKTFLIKSVDDLPRMEDGTIDIDKLKNALDNYSLKLPKESILNDTSMGRIGRFIRFSTGTDNYNQVVKAIVKDVKDVDEKNKILIQLMKYTRSGDTLNFLLKQMDIDSMTSDMLQTNLSKSLSSLMDNFTTKMGKDKFAVSSIIKLIQKADNPEKIINLLEVKQLEKLLNLSNTKGFSKMDDEIKNVFYDFRKAILDGDEPVLLKKIKETDLTKLTDDEVISIAKMTEQSSDIDKYIILIKKVDDKVYFGPNQTFLLIQNNKKILEKMNSDMYQKIDLFPEHMGIILDLMKKNKQNIDDIKNDFLTSLKTDIEDGYIIPNQVYSQEQRKVLEPNIDYKVKLLKLLHKYSDETVEFDSKYVLNNAKFNKNNIDEFLSIENHLTSTYSLDPFPRDVFLLKGFINSEEKKQKMIEIIYKLGYKYNDLVDMGITNISAFQRQGVDNISSITNVLSMLSLFGKTADDMKNMKRFGLLDQIDRMVLNDVGELTAIVNNLIKYQNKLLLEYMVQISSKLDGSTNFISILKQNRNDMIDDVLKNIVAKNSIFFENLYKNTEPLNVSKSVFTKGLEFMVSNNRIFGVQFIRRYLKKYSDNFRNPKSNNEVVDQILDIDISLCDIFTLNEFIDIFEIQSHDIGRYLLAFNYINSDDLKSLLPENMTIDLFIRSIFYLGLDDDEGLTDRQRNNFKNLLSELFPRQVENGVPIKPISNIELYLVGVSPAFFIRYELLKIFDDAGINIDDEFDLFVNKYNADNEEDLISEEINVLDISPEAIGSNPAADSFLRQTVSIGNYEYKTMIKTITYKGQVMSINIPQVKFINYIKIPKNMSSVRDFYEYMYETMYNIYLNPRYNNDIKNLLIGNILFMIENGENKMINMGIQNAIYDQVKEELIDTIMANMGKIRQRAPPKQSGEGDTGKERINELNFKIRENNAILTQKLQQLEICWKKSQGQVLSGKDLDNYVKKSRKNIEGMCRKRQDVIDNGNNFDKCVIEERQNFFIEYYENVINNISHETENYEQILNQVKDMIIENIAIFGYDKTDKNIAELFNLLTQKLYINSKINNKV